VGAGIGVGAGLAIGIAASTEECTGLGCPPTGAGVTAGLALIFGGVGAGLGALIGSMSHVERWEQVERPWVSAQLARSDGGVVVGVVVSW